MKPIRVFALAAAALLMFSGCSVPLAAVAPQPEAYASGLGEGGALAFDASGALYFAGASDGRRVVWRITGPEAKEVYAPLNPSDPILSIFGSDPGPAGVMAVDGLGTVWTASPVNSQYFAAAPNRDARIVYVNRQITCLFDVEIASGVACDPDSGAVYIVTSGPEDGDPYSSDLSCHVAARMPSKENFLEGVSERVNGWDTPPLYMENEGVELKAAGAGLIAAAGGALYFIGTDQLYRVRDEAQPFGPKFDGLALKGGAADGGGNIYLSACAADSDGAVGDIYRVGPDGSAAVLVKGAAAPRGLAWLDGYLYFADGAGGRVFRVKTGG